MARTAGEIRAEVIARMKVAIGAGKSASAFIRESRTAGLAYRRTTMLADWRTVGDIEKKTGLLKYVRKDYVPSVELARAEGWKLSREYMFKVKVQTRIRPGAPVVERFVNIVNDTPMTPRQIETEVQKQWGKWYPERREEITAVIPETAIHRIS